jgi:chromate transporter
LTTRAIIDLPTAAIALVSLVVLWRYKISEPIIVSVAGLVGLVLWPIFH